MDQPEPLGEGAEPTLDSTPALVLDAQLLNARVTKLSTALFHAQCAYDYAVEQYVFGEAVEAVVDQARMKYHAARREYVIANSLLTSLAHRLR
ncbi:MAG TPA: hypothetical protein VGK19_18280 [Capsulimonadaceae bacterium]|jgi:hypothetical protein